MRVECLVGKEQINLGNDLVAKYAKYHAKTEANPGNQRDSAQVD